MTEKWDATSEHLLRELAPQVLGAVARRFRDFSSAEDAVQEAMIAAFTQWPPALHPRPRKNRKRRATAPSTCGASSRNRCSEVASHFYA